MVEKWESAMTVGYLFATGHINRIKRTYIKFNLNKNIYKTLWSVCPSEDNFSIKKSNACILDFINFKHILVKVLDSKTTLVLRPSAESDPGAR